MRWNSDFGKGAVVEVLARHVAFLERMAIHVNLSFDDAHAVTRDANHALDIAFRRIERIVKYDDIAPLDRLKLVYELVDEDALLVLQTGKHAGAFDSHRLVEKDNE